MNLFKKSKSRATRFVAGLIGVAMAFALVIGGAVAPAQAALSSTQVDAIISLLTSFGADAATITNVRTSLQGGTPTGTGSTGTVGTGYTFTRNLTVGDTGEDVKQLQMILNQDASTQIATSGVGSAGNETTYFGGLTKEAVIKFQNKYASEVLAPVGLAVGTGFVGASTRAKLNMLGGTSTGTGTTGTGTTGTGTGSVVIPSGSGLRVSLASDSPNFTALVAGQAIGELGKFTFVNPTAAPIKVTNIGFQRVGSSADSTLSNIYLFNGGMRITEAGGLSNTVFSYNDSTGIFTVPAGGTVNISVRSDIAVATAGQQVGVQLNSVTTDAALDSSVSLPITGGVQTISSASLGTVTMTYNGPSNAIDNPANDVRVFEASTVVGTHAVNLSSIAFENRGTSDDGDLVNVRLYIDGVQVGAPVTQFTNKRATFDMSSNPVRLETGTRIIKVLADIVDGSSYTYDVQLRRAADIMAIDAQLGQAISVSAPISAGTANNTIAAGSISVSRATDSPNSNVTVGATNALWSKFLVRATGEDVKVEAITVDVDTTAGDGMDNVKVFVNGSQVGSTKDVGSTGSETGTEFTFGSSFVAKAGVDTIVEIYGDAKEADATDFSASDTVVVGFSIAAADTEGMSSGNTVSAVSVVDGFSRTIASTSTSASKASGFGDQTYVAGKNNIRIGSFTLSAGATEGINVNTVVVELSSTEAATITNLMLKDSNGAQLGTTKASPSTSNSFSVNFNIPASGTKTIDVYADIKSGADAGSLVATIDTTTGGTGATTANSSTIGSDLDLQTITVGSGTLTVAVNSGSTPDDYVAIAGASEVKVGSFRFTAQNSNFIVQEVKIKIPADAATSVSSVILKWDGGSSLPQSLTLSSGALTHATATFAGLTFEIPKNEAKDLEVYVSIPTIASAGANISGKAISALIDANEGFKAIDGAGTADTEAAGSDLNSAATSGKGTVIVRQSVPRLAAGTAPNATLSAGSNKVLGRVDISADSSGVVGWKKISFTVSKTSALTLGATSTVALWDVTGGANTQVAGSFGTTTGSLVGGLDSLVNLTSGNLTFVATNEEEIPAGTTRTYELRGTVGAIASGANNIDVSIANPSTSVSTDTASNIGITVASTPSLTWSDHSSTVSAVHSVSTSDWTNDYLIKTLPLTIGSRSVNF